MKPTAKITVYKDSDGQFRFRLTAPNGEIVFQGESYTRKADAIRAAKKLKGWLAKARLEVA